MSDLITLVVPFGAESAPICSYDRGFLAYLEDPQAAIPRWLVDVTPRAAHEFLHGGFALYEPQMRRRLSGEKASLVHVDGPTSVSFDGETYHSDETVMPNGKVAHVLTVPVESVLDFTKSHPGFSVPSAAEYEAPLRKNDAVAELHAAADAVAGAGHDSKKKEAATAPVDDLVTITAHAPVEIVTKAEKPHAKAAPKA
jgi:hypothetical protein